MSSDTEHKRTGLRILVADDDEWIRNILVRILTAARHKPNAVGRGDDAYQELLGGVYDLAILDVQMPGMGAMEIATQYSAGAGNRTPIIVLTADASMETGLKCLVLGIRKILTKPIGSQQLLDAINQVFDGSETSIKNDQIDDSDDSPISRKRLNDLMHRVYREEGALKEAIRQFFEQMNDLVTQLGQAVMNQQTTEMDRVAHKLEGCAGTFGARAVEKFCREIRGVPLASLGVKEREVLVARLAETTANVAREIGKELGLPLNH